MIEVKSASDLPYYVKCYGCGNKIDSSGVRIDVKNTAMIRGTVICLCSECRKEIQKKL